MVEMPLNQAISFLRDQHAIEIHLDDVSAEDVGVASDTPLTRHVNGITLRSALRLLLDDFNLAAVLHHDVLLITTKDRASSPEFCIARTYPVGDLIVGDDFEDLQNAITESVKPESWNEVGGPGNVAIVPAAKSFVISQTREQHDEILQLLRALRAARDLPSKK